MGKERKGKGREGPADEKGERESERVEWCTGRGGREGQPL